MLRRRRLLTALANLRGAPGWRECIRLTAGLVILRANSALFVSTVVLWAVCVAPAWPHEDPLLWLSVWMPAYLVFALLAEWVGVAGMRDPDLDNR